MSEFQQAAMNQAIEESKKDSINNYKNGGPFGATIVKDGKILISAHNTVIESKDATAHAEVNAIRKACKILNTHNLSGCILYTSTEPCPMCLSAIIWSNIKEVYYANTREDADNIGFRDDVIYKYLEGNQKDVIELHHIENKEALAVFENFKKFKDKNLY